MNYSIDLFVVLVKLNGFTPVDEWCVGKGGKCKRISRKEIQVYLVSFLSQDRYSLDPSIIGILITSGTS
jgi:hypothetical protein